MKVLSIQQPWASLVVSGNKKIETRSWVTKYRGPLLIHASASRAGKLWRIAREEPFKQYLPQYDSVTTIDGTVKQTDVDWSALPFGAIIGQVNLVDVVPTSHVLHNMELEKAAERAAPYEEALGNYDSGRYGWLLSDPVLFDKPIPAKGKLGLWIIPGKFFQGKTGPDGRNITMNNIERLRKTNPELAADYEAMSREALLEACCGEVLDLQAATERVQLFMNECTALSKTDYPIDVLEKEIKEQKERDIAWWCQTTIEDAETEGEEYIAKEVRELAAKRQ